MATESPNALRTLPRPKSGRTGPTLPWAKFFPESKSAWSDPIRQPVAGGEVGELWVRGPNVMKGYYRAPEETAAAINAEGWFNTRDLARLENGYLFIVGRTKELIIRFGENVYPAEVEAVLNANPAVVRSAVIGRTVAGTEGGEEVVAYVQLSPSSPASEESWPNTPHNTRLHTSGHRRS